ncbi:hypothetical protein JMA_26250 [Jeotgalibacillus malaysiensis]|uniref:DUF72 domain-containing protein n=1 Tax=Jeotgalibacillus malaysiensis TaxID=1508404 RepID=A0A0B5ATB0_9BACL|nr:DUF72 domain-containing protein [Jeotgalibacillus malaysiensis]AJD91942.1 hypothetical protein JMA_26250 [Jeotgalibacillus malaysiensis]
MIYIGLTGWGDHPDVYDEHSSKQDKLKDYAGHFPIVELDASFYAVQPERNMKKWVAETPDSFKFIVKAYQGMTGHQRGDIPFESKEEMFKAFRLSLTTLIEADKLGVVLLQYPPWFDCQKQNVDYIRYCKQQLEGLPLAVEFRNQTWYSDEFRDRTLQFLKDEELIHSVCDEPQAGEGSIPLIAESTHQGVTVFRLHGRNVAGWTKKGNENSWREVRYLYDYREAELKDLVPVLQKLDRASDKVYVLFNNNSGGHAAANAKTMIELLGLDYGGLAPRQLDLF